MERAIKVSMQHRVVLIEGLYVLLGEGCTPVSIVCRTKGLASAESPHPSVLYLLQMRSHGGRSGSWLTRPGS